MAAPDRKSYDTSSIDWPGLRQLAERAAKETQASHSGDYWVLESRFWNSDNTSNTSVITEDGTCLYCLRTDGELFLRVEYVRWFSGEKHSDMYEHPMTDEDVILFDFKPNYYSSNDNRNINSNTNPSDELLYQTKGEGLSVLLNKLLVRSR